MRNNDLTILLTVRGRHLHTLRWMWHANRIHLPYHVIIADGEVHPTIDRLLSDPATFPNLSYEYHRYCDITYSDFYKKLIDIIRRVKTEFVMSSDNDDFLIETGIQKSIEYLKNDPEYVCAGGGIPFFSIDANRELPNLIIGSIVNMRFGYANQCRDIAFSSVSERVMDEIVRYQPVSYHVYRAPALRVIYGEFETHDFSDLSVAEFYHALRTVTIGKVHTNPAVICYIRQTGTSTNAMVSNDWVYYLLRGKLPQDFRALASAISEEVMRIDGNISVEFREDILAAYANYIRHMLGATMMRHRFPRLFRLKQRLLWLKGVRVIPQWVQRRLQMKRFWRMLSSYGADGTLMAAHKEEFLNIETTLRGDDFLLFVKVNAPDLISVCSDR